MTTLAALAAPALSTPAVAGHATQPGAVSRAARTVRLVFQALGEGLTAHDTYHALRARGVPHADAAKQAFADR